MKTLLSRLKKADLYEKLTILLLSIVTIVQVILAIGTPMGVSPDEDHHYYSVMFYVDESLDPFVNEQDNYFRLGDMTRVGSYLYPYTLSFIVRATPFLEDHYLILRLVNVILSVINFCLLYFTARTFLKESRTSLLTMLITYSFLMFLFLGSFINYDNQAITFSILITYGYLRYLRRHDVRSLLIIAVASLFGAITKFTLVPLSFLVLLALLFNRSLWIHLRDPRTLIKQIVNERKLTLLAIIGSILFLERYGLNLIQYRSIQPACDIIHKKAECMQNLVFARNDEIFGQGINGEKLPILRYLYLWVRQMYTGAVGIFGHRSLTDWEHAWKFFLIISVGTMAGVISIIKKRQWGEVYLGLLLIPLAYAVILISNIHYPSYLQTGSISLAVQGRYLFPVFPIFIIGMVYYISNIKKGWSEILILTSTLVLFVFSIIFLFNNIEQLWG